MNDILRDSDRTKGALYFHFPSKSALAARLIEQERFAWEGAVNVIRARYIDPLQKLLVYADLEAVNSMHDPITRATRRVIREEPSFQESLRTWHNSRIELLICLVDEAKTAGLVRAGIDPRSAGELMYCSIVGSCELANEGLEDDPTIWTRVSRIMMGMLPAIAPDHWLTGWRMSNWHCRPTPSAEEREPNVIDR